MKKIISLTVISVLTVLAIGFVLGHRVSWPTTTPDAQAPVVTSVTEDAELPPLPTPTDQPVEKKKADSSDTGPLRKWRNKK